MAISKDYDSISAAAKLSERRSLAILLNEIMEADQSVRYQADKSKRPAIDSLNVEKLASFIERYGFPSFQKTGFFEQSRRGPMMPGTVWQIMWHLRGKETKLDDILLRAVLNGDFPPQDYAVLMDQKGQHYYSALPKDGLKGIDKMEINEERAKIYLDQIDLYEEKLNFQLNDKRFVIIQFMAFALNFAKPVN